MIEPSILKSVKKAVGVDPNYEVFDIDIIMHINTVFDTLHQLGVGTVTPFHIEDATAQWTDFITVDDFHSVKSYMIMRVRLLFDPPTTSFAIDAYQKQIQEFEWRFSAMTSNVVTATPIPVEPISPFWWDLTGLADFPEEAQIGDVGIDFATSNIWRKA